MRERRERDTATATRAAESEFESTSGAVAPDDWCSPSDGEPVRRKEGEREGEFVGA
jgi:hypothetical protein